jgi:Fe-S cluster biogenesis protein NfuA/nitrite reductase/ring-hydroxylating ferredoxin subunit
VKLTTVGDRIEQLLAGLRAGKDKETAEELVRLLVDLYGDALTRVVRTLDTGQVLRLAEDELVESLLLLHGIHPLDVDTRIQRALDTVRPYLGSHAGGVEYLGVDAEGVAHLRLEGSCHGCPSSTVTVRSAIEGAVVGAAPEVARVEVSGMTEPGLLQVGIGPPDGWHAPSTAPAAGSSTASAAAPAADSRAGWTALPDLGPPTGRPEVVELDGARVLVCSIRGTLYAYRDACAVCGSGLGEADLQGNVLTCPACGAKFNARLAGRGLDGTTHHLEPIPLLSDSQGVRVAIPGTVPS